MVPERVRVPAPALTRSPLATVWAKVTLERTVMTGAAPFRSMPPVKVSAPLPTAWPSVTPAFRSTSLAKVRAVVPSAETPPPLTVRTPVPKTLSPPARIRPAFRVRPPSKVLAPVSRTVPVVVLSTETPTPARSARNEPDCSS